MVELINAIHAFPSDNSQHRFQALDLLFGDGKIVFGEHCKICELTGSEHTLRILFRREPTTPVCIQPESLFTRQAILFRGWFIVPQRVYTALFPNLTYATSIGHSHSMCARFLN